MITKLRCLWLCAILLAASSASAQTRIALRPNKASHQIEVTGCDESMLSKIKGQTAQELNQQLQVFVKATFDKGEKPSVLGSVRVEDKAILFEPRFPLEPGLEYLVRFRESATAPWQTQIVSVPKKSVEATTVVKEIYPTANQLPQNLLKFYVYFSNPMTQGEAYRHIELQGADGKPVAFPFLEIAEELWDKSGQRLTLLLDPARVKRGLVPREEDGPILMAGSKYRLIIKTSWPDAQGLPLAKPFVKSFTVVAEDYRQPDAASWKIKSPKSKTREPLTFIMPEPMDHATFARGVTIENSKGEIVLGEFTFSHQETQAHFTPLKDWRPGLYDVRILKRIEDLVGNSIQRPFELDRFDTVSPSPTEQVSLTVEVE